LEYAVSKPYYTLDEETQGFLDAILHLAAAVADIQRNESDAEDIYNLLAETAERFGIDTEPFCETESFTDNVTHLRNFTVIHGDGPAVKDSESQTTEEN
jgi:hypothetical protein